MAVFVWKGRNRLGDVVEGERIAKSAADLTRILQREQVTVINVKKKPTEITLFIADVWKNEMINIIQENLERGNREFKLILSELMEVKGMKRHGKEVSKILPRLLKDPSKMPEIILGSETELKTLKEVKKFLNEYNPTNSGWRKDNY